MIRKLLLKFFNREEPRLIYQTSFGELFFVNGKQKYYEGMTDKEGTNLFFNLIVDVENEESLVRLLPKLEQLIESIELLDEKAKHFSAKELLDIYNNEWKDKTAKNIQIDEFLKQINLDEIYFRNDSTFGFDYKADSLFNGHHIHVEFSEKSEVLSANL